MHCRSHPPHIVYCCLRLSSLLVPHRLRLVACISLDSSRCSFFTRTFAHRHSYSSLSLFVLAAPHHLFSSYTYSPRSRLFSPSLHLHYRPSSFVILANGVLCLHALATESFVWVLPILSSFILVFPTSPRHLFSSFVLVVFVLTKLFALWSVCLRRRIFLVCPSGPYIRFLLCKLRCHPPLGFGFRFIASPSALPSHSLFAHLKHLAVQHPVIHDTDKPFLLCFSA